MRSRLRSGGTKHSRTPPLLRCAAVWRREPGQEPNPSRLRPRGGGARPADLQWSCGTSRWISRQHQWVRRGLSRAVGWVARFRQPSTLGAIPVDCPGNAAAASSPFAVNTSSLPLYYISARRYGMVHSTRPLIGGLVVPWLLLAQSAIGHPGSGIVVTSAGREGQSPRRDRLGCRGRACGVNQDTISSNNMQYATTPKVGTF